MDVPATPPTVIAAETKRISELVVDRAPAAAVPAQQGGMDWQGLIQAVLQAVTSNPVIMNKLFGIQEAAAPQVVAQVPVVKRDQVIAYAGMLKWAPPSMVKDRVQSALRDAAGKVEAMAPEEVKARAERLLAQATDSDLDVLKAAFQVVTA